MPLVATFVIAMFVDGFERNAKAPTGSSATISAKPTQPSTSTIWRTSNVTPKFQAGIEAFKGCDSPFFAKADICRRDTSAAGHVTRRNPR